MRPIHQARPLRPRRALSVAICALAAILLVPSATSAATSPYGHPRITYKNKSTYVWQVNEAFAVWNRAGTPFRFVPARPGKRADITVTQKRYIGSPSSAIAGFGGIGFVQLSKARFNSPKGFHNGQVRLVAHEIGHALGLDHLPSRCGIMYSSIDYPRAVLAASSKRGGTPGSTVARARLISKPSPVFGISSREQSHGGATARRPPIPPRLGRARTSPARSSGSRCSSPMRRNGVQLTLTNNGNTVHEIGSYGIVVVDAAGRVLSKPWSFYPDWYYIDRLTPRTGPVCSRRATAMQRRAAAPHARPAGVTAPRHIPRSGVADPPGFVRWRSCRPYDRVHQLLGLRSAPARVALSLSVS